jgi:hypothetical protein
VGVQKSPHCTKHNAHTREFGYSTEMRKRVKVTLQGRKQCSTYAVAQNDLPLISVTLSITLKILFQKRLRIKLRRKTKLNIYPGAAQV